MCHNQEVQFEQATLFQIRLFTVKGNEDLKQVAHVNYIVFV